MLPSSAIISQTFQNYLIGPYKLQFDILCSVKINLVIVSDNQLTMGYMFTMNSADQTQLSVLEFG